MHPWELEQPWPEDFDRQCWQTGSSCACERALMSIPGMLDVDVSVRHCGAATVLSVRPMSDGPLAVGSRYEMRQPKLRPAIWQVTDLEEQRRFDWQASAAGLQMKAGHSVEPDGAGSRVELSFEVCGFLAPVIGRLYGRLIEDYVGTESKKLKSRCEFAAGYAAGLGNK